MIFNIEFTPQEDLDLDPTSIPSQQLKWDQQLIKTSGDGVVDPYDKIKMTP